MSCSDIGSRPRLNIAYSVGLHIQATHTGTQCVNEVVRPHKVNCGLRISGSEVRTTGKYMLELRFGLRLGLSMEGASKGTPDDAKCVPKILVRGIRN